MNPIEIQVTSDFICPWCWIGHRNLKAAIEQAADKELVQVRYVPFELNPAMPRIGSNREEYRTRKFGSWARSQAMDAEVTLAGKRVGAEFNYDRVEVTPNTRLAHRLMWFAQSQSDTAAVDIVFEAIFAAYFQEGRDIGSLDVLVAVAGSSGLDADAVRAYLTTTDGERDVIAAELQAQVDGIHAVPTIRIAGERVSGAQPSRALAQMLRAAATEESLA